jgi:chromosome segregation ATPase
MELLNKITHLEEENLTFHERNLKLTELREYDEKRMDKISDNLNDVFKETKQLVRMTSSLKHQLEAKVLELNQIKEDKQLLEAELIQFKKDYKNLEVRNKELENKINQMGSELHKAKQSLSLLEQIQLEKNQLSEELESKMKEFILITENYQREKASYQTDLEHVQEQIKGYKERTNRFEVEKAEWSTQMNELKTKLEQAREDLQKREELEHKNNNLAEELRAKEIEIFKIKKENELALLQKTNHFNSEIKMKQDYLRQSELDREKLEKQINEIKVQFNVLESNLEEKENFIRLFIKQPLSQPNLDSQATEGQSQQKLSKSVDQHIQETSFQQQVQQSFDWFQQIKAQQQYTYQQTPSQTKTSNPAIMDFFALRNKTTQPMNLPKPWNQKE